jgi:hypothetical protein
MFGAIAVATLVGSLPIGSADPAAAQEVREYGCTQNIGFFPLPIALLQAQLPAGFTALSADPAGALGVVFVANLECADVVVDGRSSGPARESGTGIVVAPPPAWSSPGVDTYVIATFANTEHAVAKAFRQWGIGGHGDVDASNLETPAASIGRASGTSAAMAFTMVTATEGAPAPIAAAHVRAFGVQRGEVVRVVDLLNSPATGRGGPPGGEGVPGQATIVFHPGPYDVPLLQGFAQHAVWEGLALRWDVVG